MAWYASWEAAGDILLHRLRSFSESVRFCRTISAALSLLCIQITYKQSWEATIAYFSFTTFRVSDTTCTMHRVQQFSHCCEWICCCGNMFTQPRPCSCCPIGSYNSGFQASGHVQTKSYFTCFLCVAGHIKNRTSSESK
jgi:hypothetical protein